MQMQSGEKKDKIKFILLVLSQNAHSYLTHKPPNTSTKDLKIEILTGQV